MTLSQDVIATQIKSCDKRVYMCFTNLRKIAQTHICKFYTSRQNPANSFIQVFPFKRSRNSTLLKTLLSKSAFFKVLAGAGQDHFCLLQNKTANV